MTTDKGPDFNTEENLHADTIAERHDARHHDKRSAPFDWPSFDTALRTMDFPTVREMVTALQGDLYAERVTGRQLVEMVEERTPPSAGVEFKELARQLDHVAFNIANGGHLGGTEAGIITKAVRALEKCAMPSATGPTFAEGIEAAAQCAEAWDYPILAADIRKIATIGQTGVQK